MLDPGALRDTVRIEEVKAREPDGAGGYSKVWGPIPDGAHVWAFIEPVRGEERIRADQQRSNALHRVVIRWMPGVTSLCRLVWNGEVYEIVEPPRKVSLIGSATTRVGVSERELEFLVRQEPREGRDWEAA